MFVCACGGGGWGGGQRRWLHACSSEEEAGDSDGIDSVVVTNAKRAESSLSGLSAWIRRILWNWVVLFGIERGNSISHFSEVPQRLHDSASVCSCCARDGIAWTSAAKVGPRSGCAQDGSGGAAVPATMTFPVNSSHSPLPNC